VSEQTGEEIAYSDIVKGYDLGGGEYVILTPEELNSVAPGPSRTIEVTDFVELSEIDPIYFDKPYFLAPHGKNGDRAYELLRKVMAETNKVAIGSFVMREKQYLVAVRPEKSSLVLETLLFADEVRDPVKEIDVLPVQASFEDREIEMAKLLIDSMTTPWEPESYRDTYRERVEDLIEQKRQGAVVMTEGPRAEPAPVVDLLAALQASVSAVRGRSTPPASLPAPPAQKPPAVAARPRQVANAAKMRPASRTELIRQAADLSIGGRSKMSREELERAIADASAPRRRKAS
jgi:DNA end-binding protein Ku